MENLKRKKNRDIGIFIILIFIQMSSFSQLVGEHFEERDYQLISIDSCANTENFNEVLNVKFKKNGLLKRLIGADGSLHFYSNSTIEKDSKNWASITMNYELKKKSEIFLVWKDIHKEQENFDKLNINVHNWFYDISNSKGNLKLIENGMIISVIYSNINQNNICINLTLFEK